MVVQFIMSHRPQLISLACALLLANGCLPGRGGPPRPSGPPEDATVPGSQWTRMTRPEDADWFSVRLREARELSDTLGSAAVMIVHRGVVVESWGSTARKYPVGELGRSIVSVLYGRRIAAGEVSAPLASKALEEPRLAEVLREYAGARPPGPVMVLGEDFATQIGRFIDAEHLTPADFASGPDGEPRIMMTASDLARYGLLHLRRGNWGGRQLIPWEWIDATTLPPARRQSDDKRVNGGWTPLSDLSIPALLAGAHGYTARGTGGQVVAVMPTHDLVVVHMVDTDGGSSVSFEDVGRLIAIILRAKP